MNRVKKQLHEWDENLKDDSLPTNAVGQPCYAQPLFRLGSHLFFPSFLSSLCMVSLRLLLQSGSLPAHRRQSAAAAAEDWQRHPETPL